MGLTQRAGRARIARRVLLVLGVTAICAALLSPSPAGASTLTDCLAQQHVCVAGNGRGLISPGQQAQLEQRIGSDGIYLMVAHRVHRATTPR